MTEQEIRDSLVENGFENTIIYTNPSYADAYVGVTTDGIAIYDYDRMVECLMKDGMNEEEAIEWIDYNCVGAQGEGMPMIVNISNPVYAVEENPVQEKVHVA
jgi:hypothetical protein